VAVSGVLLPCLVSANLFFGVGGEDKGRLREGNLSFLMSFYDYHPLPMTVSRRTLFSLLPLPLLLVLLALARDSTLLLGVGVRTQQRQEEEVCTSQMSNDETTRTTTMTTTKSSKESSTDRIVSSLSSSSSSTTTRIECDLYLAESTIPGAGLGMFSAVPFRKGQSWGHGDPIIPILEPRRHCQNREGHPDYDEDTSFDVTYDYVWSGDSLGMKLEVAASSFSSSWESDVTAYWAGVGAAINFHTALNNIGSSKPTYDEVHLHRSTHPGVGAFTPYHLAIPRVIRDIPAGGEVFKDYGNDEWYVPSRVCVCVCG
jgi:hypothetical protein